MTVTAHADILGAITAKLRSVSEVTALASTRIGGEIQSDWFPGAKAQYAVLLRRTGGPISIDDWLVGKRDSRVDCTCYGSSKRAAERLMAVVLPALCPDASQRGAFVQSVTMATNTTQNVRVSSIFPETDVIVSAEPDTGYDYAFCALIATWSAF